jgi:tRNA threonylcarbamoyladenosine biosynthesis protein TsaE
MPSTEQFIFDAADEAGTVVLGAALAECLPPRAVVALIGTLGAGKTRLVQAVAAAAGVDPRDVMSPTFVLIHEYQGRLPIYHFDTYRLRDEDEFLRLGPEEYFERSAWTFIEWADRVERCLPRERLEIRIESTGPTSRRFEISAIGEPSQAVVLALSKHLAS